MVTWHVVCLATSQPLHSPSGLHLGRVLASFGWTMCSVMEMRTLCYPVPTLAWPNITASTVRILVLSAQVSDPFFFFFFFSFSVPRIHSLAYLLYHIDFKEQKAPIILFYFQGDLYTKAVNRIQIHSFPNVSLNINPSLWFVCKNTCTPLLSSEACPKFVSGADFLFVFVNNPAHQHSAI